MRYKLRHIIRRNLHNIMQEGKKDIIKDKIKLPEMVADWAYELGDKKYSIWIANDFKDFFIGHISNYIPNEIIRNAAISMMEQGKLSGGLIKIIRSAMSDREGQYAYIMDWLNGRGRGENPENDNINIKQMSFDYALERSEAWHNRLAQLATGHIEDEDGDIVQTFPDGYYWINLGVGYCTKEAKAMGHCGSGDGILYSLRKDGRPAITADIMEDGIVRQMRGKANSKPNPKYHKYIVDFIKSDIVRNFDYWDYRKSDNFLMTDLNRNEAFDIFEEKPSLIRNQDVKKLWRFFGDEIFNLIYHMDKRYFDKYFEDNGIEYIG